MSGLALPTEQPAAPASSGAPRLRLLPKRTGPRASEASGPRHPASTERHAEDAATTPPAEAPVLIADRDAARRSRVRRELSEVMPAGTRFEELGTFWEVLEQAPASRVVVLSGEVDEHPAESLLHTLAHRHPDLPVVSLGEVPST
jgi:hypothetical protein